MSAPVREPDDDGPSHDEPLSAVPLSSGPLHYAPKRTRRSEQKRSEQIRPEQNRLEQNRSGAQRKLSAASPRRSSESSEPPWKRKTTRGAFAGDVAIAELRTQLALAPDWILEPPLPAPTVPVFATVGRIIGVIVVAGAAFIGYRWGSAAPTTPPPQLALASDHAELAPEQPAANLASANLSAANPKALYPDTSPSVSRSATIGLAPGSGADPVRGAANGGRSADAPPRPVPVTESRAFAAPAAASPQPAAAPPASAPQALVPQPNGQSSPDPAPAPALPRQLTVNATRLRQADEPARLTISAAEAGANVAVVIGGLAPGSALSAGTPAGPSTWRLSTENFKDAAVTPPRGFVGVMDPVSYTHLTLPTKRIV